MFKAGDRVVRTGDSIEKIKKGETYTVREVVREDAMYLNGHSPVYDPSKFKLVEYEWPCRVCDATEHFYEGKWLEWSHQSCNPTLSYNHRREIKPSRPVTAEDIGKEVMWANGEKAVLKAYGPELCVVQCHDPSINKFSSHIVPTENLTTHG